MTIPWYVTALGAAVVWGVHYPLVDFALKRLSLMSVLLLTAIPVALAAPFFHRTLSRDITVWAELPWATRVPILALLATSFLGAVLLYLSIRGKNATLASLIEISYPVFVALFSYLLFRQIQLTPSVLLGSALVFCGVAVIIWHNP